MAGTLPLTATTASLLIHIKTLTFIFKAHADTQGPGGSYRGRCVKVCERPGAEQFKCLHVLGAIWSLSAMQPATIVNRPGRADTRGGRRIEAVRKVHEGVKTETKR